MLLRGRAIFEQDIIPFYPFSYCRRMSKIFISHSSKDDVFVGKLRKALHDHGIDGWID